MSQPERNPQQRPAPDPRSMKVQEFLVNRLTLDALAITGGGDRILDEIEGQAHEPRILHAMLLRPLGAWSRQGHRAAYATARLFLRLIARARLFVAPTNLARFDGQALRGKRIAIGVYSQCVSRDLGVNVVSRLPSPPDTSGLCITYDPLGEPPWPAPEPMTDPRLSRYRKGGA